MIAIIKPIPVTYSPGVFTVSNSYAQHGYNRQPGAGVGYPPIMSAQTGKYLTGLDENALEILNMLNSPDPEKKREGERIQKEIKERRERLEASTGLDLGPRSDYYTKMYEPGFYNTNRVAKKIKLYDRENTFNFSDPHEEISYWWLTQNRELIAPSLIAWRSGKHGKAQFYIENSEEEAEITYQKNMSMSDAVKKLSQMAIDVRKKTAKLLGIGISENDNELVVYNKLYEFIMTGIIDRKHINYGGQLSVDVFNRIANLSSPVMNAKYMVQTALELRIYTKRNGVLYEGPELIAKSEEELIDILASSNRTAEYLALEIKINDKNKISGGIEGLAYLTTPKFNQVNTEDVAVQKTKKSKENTELS